VACTILYLARCGSGPGCWDVGHAGKDAALQGIRP
jgi:hypothetical protein